MTAGHVEMELQSASHVVTVARRDEEIAKRPVKHHSADFDFVYSVLVQIAVGTDS